MCFIIRRRVFKLEGFRPLTTLWPGRQVTSDNAQSSEALAAARSQCLDTDNVEAQACATGHHVSRTWAGPSEFHIQDGPGPTTEDR